METLLLTERSITATHSIEVITLEGELDIKEVKNLGYELRSFFARGQYRIVLDFEDLTYISSAGLGLLFSAAQEARKNKGDIKISNASPDICKIFDLVELSGS